MRNRNTDSLSIRGLLDGIAIGRTSFAPLATASDHGPELLTRGVPGLLDPSEDFRWFRSYLPAIEGAGGLRGSLPVIAANPLLRLPAI